MCYSLVYNYCNVVAELRRVIASKQQELVQEVLGADDLHVWIQFCLLKGKVGKLFNPDNTTPLQGVACQHGEPWLHDKLVYRTPAQPLKELDCLLRDGAGFLCHAIMYTKPCRGRKVNEQTLLPSFSLFGYHPEKIEQDTFCHGLLPRLAGNSLQEGVHQLMLELKLTSAGYLLLEYPHMIIPSKPSGDLSYSTCLIT